MVLNILTSNAQHTSSVWMPGNPFEHVDVSIVGIGIGLGVVGLDVGSSSAAKGAKEAG